MNLQLQKRLNFFELFNFVSKYGYILDYKEFSFAWKVYEFSNGFWSKIDSSWHGTNNTTKETSEKFNETRRDFVGSWKRFSWKVSWWIIWHMMRSRGLGRARNFYERPGPKKSEKIGPDRESVREFGPAPTSDGGFWIVLAYMSILKRPDAFWNP